MLSLIPALILIVFHGPSGVERLAHEGRLPDALRALERVLHPAEADGRADSELGDEKRAKAGFYEWTPIVWGPELTQALSQWTQVSYDSESDSPTPIEAELPHNDNLPITGLECEARRTMGCIASNPTRAGPCA